jgi:hypothetical protein
MRHLVAVPVLLLAVSALALGQPAWETRYWNITGAGPDGYLAASPPEPLSFFKQHLPRIYDSPPRVQWIQASPAPTGRIVLSAPGLVVYESVIRANSGGSTVLIAGPDAKALRAIFVVNWDSTLVNTVEPARSFNYLAHTVFGVTIQLAGNSPWELHDYWLASPAPQNLHAEEAMMDARRAIETELQGEPWESSNRCNFNDEFPWKPFEFGSAEIYSNWCYERMDNRTWGPTSVVHVTYAIDGGRLHYSAHKLVTPPPR